MREPKYYTIGRLEQEICFPEDKVCCNNCEKAYSDSLGRMACSVLHRLIFSPYEQPKDCHIQITGEIRGMKKDG